MQPSVKKLSPEWIQRWKLSGWYKEILDKISEAQAQKNAKAFQVTRPDHDAELEDCRNLIKLVIVGGNGTGKTNLFVRYLYSTYVSDPNMVLASKSEYSKIVEIDEDDKYKVVIEELKNPSGTPTLSGAELVTSRAFDS